VLAAIGVAATFAIAPLVTSVAATIGFTLGGGLLGPALVAGALGSALAFGVRALYRHFRSSLGFISGNDSPEMNDKTVARMGPDLAQFHVNAKQAPEPELQAEMAQQANPTFRQKLEAERDTRRASGRH
jgi:hypothetical protein